MDKPKLKLPAGKGKKIAALLVGVAVVGGGFAVMHQKPAPQPAPAMTAKQAMDVARAKLKAEDGKSADSHATPRQEVASAPAPAGTVVAAVKPSLPDVAASAVGSTTSAAGQGLASISSTMPAPASTTTAPSLTIAPAASAPVAAAASRSSPPAPTPSLQPAVPADVPQSIVQGGRDYSAYYDTIGGLSRTVRFLEMKAKIAELQRKIDGTDSGNGSTTLNSVSPVAIMPPPTMPAHKSGPATSADAVMPPMDMGLSTKADPSLRSVMMVGGKFQAVVYTHGADLSVREGASIGDGWIVRAIRDSSVTIAKGKQSKTLNIGE